MQLRYKQNNIYHQYDVFQIVLYLTIFSFVSSLWSRLTRRSMRTACLLVVDSDSDLAFSTEIIRPCNSGQKV